MRDLRGNLALCAINTATLGHREPILTVVERIARAGFGAIAPWRREVEGEDVPRIARAIRDAGLAVSGYCRSTYFPASDAAGRARALEENRRAVDDAATLGADCFVLVVGSLPPGSRDLARARAEVAEGTAKLLEYARAAGVRLALEPLHPMYAGDRSCLCTLAQALDLAEAIEGPADAPCLGVVADAYHIWWDPGLGDQLARAGRVGRILGYHVSDWLVPTRDLLLDRGMMGDGVIGLKDIRRMVEAAGYAGPVEVEIFSAADWWERPPDEVLRTCAERLQSVC